MKDIAFRVYLESPNFSGMYPVQKLDFTLGDLVVHTNGLICLPGTYKLMQWTGLKDKNGVEIFESDLVRVRIDNSIHIMEVQWEEDREFCGWNIEPGWEDIKVIGTVYDEPTHIGIVTKVEE